MRYTTRLVTVAVVAAFIPAVTLAVLAPDASASTPRGTMVHLTDTDRGEHGVADVKIDRLLCRYARQHSRAMVDAGYIYHSSDTQLRAALGDRGWWIAGENVGVGTSLSALEDAFMASPGHRENILRPTYHHVAVGVIRTTDPDRVWVTVIFWG